MKLSIDIIFIIVVIIIILCIYCEYKNKDIDIEKFQNIPDADISAIRNLNSLAAKLTTGGLTVPGSVGVADNISVTNNTDEGGRVRIINSKKTGPEQTNDWSIWNMTGGIYGDKLSFWRYNGTGGNFNNKGSAMDIFDNGTVSIAGDINTGGITRSNKIILRNDTWENKHDGNDKSYIVSDNKNYKKLMVVGNNSAGGAREVGIWDNLTVNGSTVVTGDLTVNGGERLKAIQIFNFNRGGAGEQWSNANSAAFTVGNGTKIFQANFSCWMGGGGGCFDVHYYFKGTKDVDVYFGSCLNGGYHSGQSFTRVLTNAELPAGTYTVKGTISANADGWDYMSAVLTVL
jgi:hypothetical protein